ncbi:probable dolichyl-diphosphooligosaccharide--protein glycosyltransferase subunit 3B [Rutidosis leptorrhynchoides]|uniref:probable dolichyl-diphosphooligosaccharide--protein glycosyltransferase subunit 3B n=1 Tax=Rutidosis leptorrhynchoides TaxID=125765 RepID=UPI003A99023A
MAISVTPKHTLIPLILQLLIFLSPPSATATADVTSDLISLRSHSSSGIIHLHEPILNRIIELEARSFYLIIFFDAIQLHNQPESNLKSIKSEFALISNSFIINNKNTSFVIKLFFCEIEFSESEKLFLKFGVNALPNIRIVPPNVHDLKSESIQFNVGDYSDLADAMVTFIESKVDLSIGRIHRPPTLSKTHLGFIIGVILLRTPFMIKKVISGETIFHNKNLWLSGTLFIYFFSISGFMFILIRKIPLFVIDRKDSNKVVFFYKGNGMQFGAEGMCVGFLFTLVGLLLVFVTRFVVKINDSMIQRGAMISAMIVSFWAVKEVVRLSHWKSGYAVHAYLPSNWYK